MHGEIQGKYYRYCSRSIRYSTDLNSENNKFDMETFDLVSEYCKPQDSDNRKSMPQCMQCQDSGAESCEFSAQICDNLKIQVLNTGICMVRAVNFQYSVPES